MSKGLRISDLRPGMDVHDRWWPLDNMIVLDVLKTRVRFRVVPCGLYDHGMGTIRTYDRAHLQFLEVGHVR